MACKDCQPLWLVMSGRLSYLLDEKLVAVWLLRGLYFVGAVRRACKGVCPRAGLVDGAMFVMLMLLHTGYPLLPASPRATLFLIQDTYN